MDLRIKGDQRPDIYRTAMTGAVLFKNGKLSNESALGALHKSNKYGYLGRFPFRFFYFRQRVAGVHFGTKADAIGLFEFSNALFRKALALEPYNIDAVNLCLISIPYRSDKRECIPRDNGKTANKRIGADAAELVHG